MIRLFDRFSKKDPTPHNVQQNKSDNAVVGTDVKVCSLPESIDKQKQPLSVLKQFVPIRSLDDTSIEMLLHTTQSYRAGATIFVRGQHNHSVYYLLEGILELSPNNGCQYQVSAEDTALAHLPLNSGKICGASAIALTDVKIINVSADLMQLWARQSKEQTEYIELINLELPKELSDNRFFVDFAQMYRENKLVLPSLPTVALKLKKAMQEDIDIAEAARIIQIDPAIATKLIQITNSPLYSPVKPITNCQDAITRLGLNATRTLVMGIGLKQMFRCKNKKLLKAMEVLWRNSLYLSSLSFVLAEESRAVNPEDALLAGLICDIGIIPLLHFAEQNPEQYPDLMELQRAIPHLRAPVGTLMLHTLGFSEQLAQIPHHAEDWFFESEETKLTLIDIVILAKLHSYIGHAKGKQLPYISSIPAYAKLKNGELTPDFSLTALHKAKQRINAAMQVLT